REAEAEEAVGSVAVAVLVPGRDHMRGVGRVDRGGRLVLLLLPAAVVRIQVVSRRGNGRRIRCVAAAFLDGGVGAAVVPQVGVVADLVVGAARASARTPRL